MNFQKFTTCQNPPSRGHYRKASFPRAQQRDRVENREFVSSIDAFSQDSLILRELRHGEKKSMN